MYRFRLGRRLSTDPRQCPLTSGARINFCSSCPMSARAGHLLRPNQPIEIRSRDIAEPKRFLA